MKSQTPAEGILLRKDYGDAKIYTVTCQCCGSDCEHDVWVEADDLNVTITTYTQQKNQVVEFKPLTNYLDIVD